MLQKKISFPLALLSVALLASCSLSYPKQQQGSTSIVSSGEFDTQNIERFYEVNGQRYAILKTSTGFTESGTASWYGDPFHGRKTSNGETYNMYEMTAAHKHLPLPTYVEVTNTLNGKSVVLRVNDRGPFVGNRVIDLSYAAAKALDTIASGTAPVKIRALDKLNTVQANQRTASPERPAFIQLASFEDRNNAYAYNQGIIRQGISNSLIHQTQTSNNQKVYRVQIGPLVSDSDYDHNIQQLRKIGINNTILIRE